MIDRLPPSEDPPAGAPPSRAFSEHAPTMLPPPGETPAEAHDTDPPTFEAQVLAELQELRRAIGSLDAGMRAAWDELGALRGDTRTAFDAHAIKIDRLSGEVRQGFADVRLWLFGFGGEAPAVDGAPPPRSIAGDLGMAREQAASALGAINAMAPRLERIEATGQRALRVACASYDGVFHGTQAVPHDEQEAVTAIRDAARAARG